MELKREGKRYRHKQHDSLIFTDNSYYWNSRQEKGNSIDYLVRNMGLGFVEAVKVLSGESGLGNVHSIASSLDIPATIKPDKVFELNPELINDDISKAKSYLSEVRKIDSRVIDYLVKENLLLQEKQTNNIIFPMLDENGICVGAELQGVTQKRFKGIMGDSKFGYGFNIGFGGTSLNSAVDKSSPTQTFNYALFFESAVDLISFIDYKQNIQNKSLEGCLLVSMGGLKRGVVENVLEVFGSSDFAHFDNHITSLSFATPLNSTISNISTTSPKIVLCVDNDDAGRKFKSDFEHDGIEYIDGSPDGKYKDWNEQLQAVKRRSAPIGRLLVRGMEGVGGNGGASVWFGDVVAVEKVVGVKMFYS